MSMFKLGLSQTQCGLCGQDAQGSATEQELKQLDSQLDVAYIRGDKAAFERLLADDMLSVSSEGGITGKKGVLKGINPWPASLKPSLVAEDVQVHLFGDTAVVSSRKTLKWETNKRPQSDQYRETNTYARKDGRWQLVASQQAHPAPPYIAKDVQQNLKIDPALMRGDKGATVVLIEFSDYQCSFCRRFAAQTIKQIEQDYLNTGHVGFVFRDYPMEGIHPYAFKAAEAAQCAAAQGKFWEMHQRLYQEPMALKHDDLLAHAQALNLDVPKFRQCIADEKTDAALRQGMAEGAGLGVEGTPMFLIGVRRPDSSNVKVLRMIQGAQPYDVFKATLDTMISAQTP
jgi:protein-disulfide isomerase